MDYKKLLSLDLNYKHLECLKPILERFGDDLFDFNRIVLNAKNIAKIDNKDYYKDMECLFESVNYEITFIDNFNDLKQVKQRGGTIENCINRMVEVGIEIPLELK
ncbi:MAG: hypothetical protein ACOYMA_19055 [Bacteroidia bacterium]